MNQATGAKLTLALQSDLKQRLEETKTIVIKLSGNTRPDVTFTGFWNGRLLNSAINSISRSYRLRRHHLTYEDKKVEGEKVEGVDKLEKGIVESVEKGIVEMGTVETEEKAIETKGVGDEEIKHGV